MSTPEVCIREQLVLQPADGMVRFVQRAKVLLDHATAWVSYTDAHSHKKTLRLAGHEVPYGLARDSVSLSIADADVELTWQLILGEEMCLRLEARNIGPRTVHMDELCVLDVSAQNGGSVGFGSAPKHWRFYHNGWQSWTPAFVRHVPDGIWLNPNTDSHRTQHQPHPLSEKGKTLSSEWFSVIAPGEQQPVRSRDQALLLGFVSAADQLAEIRLELAGSLKFSSLQAVCYADAVPLGPGGRLSSETLLLAAGDEPLALLDLYATRLGEAMRARIPPQPVTGWCTWYYFYGEDTADDVRAHLDWIAKKQLPLDVILIDDGYETSIGDWLDHNVEKYPQGMKAMAERIVAAGHRPGIWTAPFAASSASRLYAEHPDWILRDQQGNPLVAWQHWGVDVYGLDLSLPVVQEWLREVFRTMAEDWDFQFFKVDFLFAAAMSGVRHDPGMTRAQALRKGLEIVRAAIGDRFLLGCGAPLGPSVGLVDAMRIGPDVHVDWRPIWQDM